MKWKKETVGGDSFDYYNTVAWHRLRSEYIKEHPVCEECLKHGKVKPATAIHHMRPFMSEKTEVARWNTFLNLKNIIAVCASCHYGFHYKLRHKHLQEANDLTEEEWKQAQVMYDRDYYLNENE